MNFGVFPRPLCSNPQLLVNRNAAKLIANGGELRYYEDLNKNEYSLYYFCPTERFNFPYKRLLRDGYRLCSETTKTGLYLLSDKCCDLLRHYVVVLGTDWCFLYQLVACGRCDICVEKKLNDFSNRCQWESQTSETRPLFITLTYDNYSIPRWVDESSKVRQRGIPIADAYEKWFNEIGHLMPYQSRICNPIYREMMSQRGLCHLSKVDAQHFLMRLRTNWTRKTDSDYHLERRCRYVLVGEYGSKSQHPHIHMILWNVPLDVGNTNATELLNLNRIKADIEKAWNMGIVDCQIAIDAARYVSKYVSKPMAENYKGFRLASNRGGGIGSHFLKANRHYYEKHPTMQEVIGMDKWSGQPFHHTMGAYATNVLFPPLRAYTSYRDYLQLYQTLETRCSHICRKINKYKYHEDFYSQAQQMLKALRISNNAYLPKQFALSLVRLPFESRYKKGCTPLQDLLEKREPTLLKQKHLKDGKPFIFMSNIVELQALVADAQLQVYEKFGSDIDDKLALRKEHQEFIPVKPMPEDFVYLKGLSAKQKQVSRTEREVF